MRIVAPASWPAVLAASQPPDAIYAGLANCATTVKPNFGEAEFCNSYKMDVGEDAHITAGREAGATLRGFHKDAAVILDCDCGAFLIRQAPLAIVEFVLFTI